MGQTLTDIWADQRKYSIPLASSLLFNWSGLFQLVRSHSSSALFYLSIHSGIPLVWSVFVSSAFCHSAGLELAPGPFCLLCLFTVSLQDQVFGTRVLSSQYWLLHTEFMRNCSECHLFYILSSFYILLVAVY